MSKIFLDPGHGGTDPGASANGVVEKEVVLDVAKRIERILKNYEDVQVMMSRTSDVYVNLSERANMANRWGADYFISIHCNAGGGVGYEDFIFNGNVSQATIANQNIMNPEIVGVTGFNNRGRKRANFAVLRQTSMPAILTENGFVDNRSDADKLKQASFREKIARGHVNGLVKIFGLKEVANVSDRKFKDVPNDYSFADDIDYVSEKNIMNGYPDGTFRPDEPVTRGQLAAVIARIKQGS